MKIKYLLLFLLIVLIPFNVSAIVPKDGKIYVTDDAGLLKSDTVDYIVKMSDFLRTNQGINYFVVTVNDLEGLEIEEYCNQVFKEYRMGDSGILILVDKNDALIRVQIGRNLAGDFTEEKITELIDTYFIPYIEHSDWNKGIYNGYNAFFKILCDKYNIDTSTIEVVEKVDFFTKYSEYILGALMIAILFVSKMIVELYKRIFKKKVYHDGVFDYFLFALLLCINIVLLLLPLLIKKEIVILFAFAELVAVYSFINNDVEGVMENTTGNNEEKKIKFKKKKKR